MFKKPTHNHYFNQTNPKTHRKTKTESKTQPPGRLAHTKHSLQQPKEKQTTKKANLLNL